MPSYCKEVPYLVDAQNASKNKNDPLFLIDNMNEILYNKLIYLFQTRDDFDFDKLHFTSARDEPYDTEDLNTVPGGYRYAIKLT